MPKQCTAQAACPMSRHQDQVATPTQATPCRAHSQRRPRAQRAQVARIAPRSWAHVATSLPCPVNRPGRDVTSMSRPPGGHPMSRHHIGVATPSLLPSIKPGRDFISRSRPLGRPTYVATPCRDILKTNLCHDIAIPCHDIKPSLATVANVATSNSCRDTVSAVHTASHVATSQ